MKRWRQVLILIFLVFVTSLGVVAESYALTRKIIRSNNHLFTYSIQPHWKSGPINDPSFDLWLKLFNDDPDPFTLKKIIVNYPKNLRIKQRRYDNKLIVRPRKNMKLDTDDYRISFTYDETLRGFVEGKLAEKKMINVEYFVPEDFSVTDPIEFRVIWSPVNKSDTDVITLKKDLAINT